MKGWSRKAFLGIFVSVAISVSSSVPSSSLASKTELAELTVLVYAAHDNNLDGLLKGDLQEMLQSRQTNVNIVVFVDRTAMLPENYKDNDAISADFWAAELEYPYVGRFSGAKVFRVRDSQVSDIVDLGEVYSHSPQTLAWFVSYGLSKYPANRSILVMKDHGGGPLALFGDVTEYDTSPDDPNLYPPFFLTSWKNAVSVGLQSASRSGWRGVDGQLRLDAVIWDTCLNGTLEVARATSAVARYMMADEEITMASGDVGSWSLDWKLARLDPAQDRSTSVVEYLKSLTKSLKFVYEGYGPDEMKIDDYSLSIQDLDKIQTVDAAVRQLTRAVETTEKFALLGEARESGVLEFGQLTMKTGADYLDVRHQFPYVDLGDLVTRLQDDAPPSVRVASAAVLNALRSSTLYQLKATRNSRAQGLSIYFPTSRVAIEDSYGLQTDPAGWLHAITRSLTVPSAVAEVQSSSVVKTTSGWKASVTLSQPINAGVIGTAVFGALQESGLHASVIQTASLRAGGTNSFQAVMSWHRFAMGSAPITAYLDFTTGVIEFPAIHVSQKTGRQTRVWGRTDAKYRDGSWQLSMPTFVTEQTGTAVPISAGDLVAPVNFVWRTLVDKEGTAFYAVVGELVQRGQPAKTVIQGTALPKGSSLSVDMLLTEAGSGRLILRENLSLEGGH